MPFALILLFADFRLSCFCFCYLRSGLQNGVVLSLNEIFFAKKVLNFKSLMNSAVDLTA